MTVRRLKGVKVRKRRKLRIKRERGRRRGRKVH